MEFRVFAAALWLWRVNGVARNVIQAPKPELESCAMTGVVFRCRIEFVPTEIAIQTVDTMRLDTRRNSETAV